MMWPQKLGQHWSHLIQLEPSMDADSWAVREKRYRKKFVAGKSHIPKLFLGLGIPTEIEQVAIFVFAGSRSRESLGGGRVLHVSVLLKDIYAEISKHRVDKKAVPEKFPILKCMQLTAQYRRVLFPDN